jgi:hypothetical protein
MTREDHIQEILTYLTFAETWEYVFDDEDIGKDLPEEQLRYLMVPLNYFNGASLEPLDPEKFSQDPEDPKYFNPYHPENSDLFTMDLGLWESCGINSGAGDDEHTPKHEKATCLYHLFKFRKMPLSEVRGRFKLVTGDLVEWAHGWVYNNGTFQTNRAIYERRGREWWLIGQPYAVNNPHPEEDAVNQAIFAGKSQAFTHYYDWRVELGFQMPGKTLLPTVSLSTDAAGAKSAYRLRDIPAGKTRRDALRHWVSTHWRKNAYDPEEEIKIWAHLRGVEEFSHNGLKCRIIPSAYDLKKAAEYQKKSKEKPHERRKVS